MGWLNLENMGPWPYPAQLNYGHACVYVDDSDNVFAAGSGLTNSAGEYYVAKWENSGWQELGAPNARLKANGHITTILKDRSGNLYVAGALRDANGKYFVAKWDGMAWSPVGTGSTAINSNSYISRLAVDASNRLFANSTFSVKFKQYVSMWNDTTWKELGELAPNNLDGRGAIYLIVTDSNTVYAGGLLLMGTSPVVVYGSLPTQTKIPAQKPKLIAIAFPNPTRGTLEITIPLAGSLQGQTASLSLLDIVGRNVFKSVALQVSGNTIRTQLPSSLCDGIYTLNVDVSGAHYMQRITLKR